MSLTLADCPQDSGPGSLRRGHQGHLLFPGSTALLPRTSLSWVQETHSTWDGARSGTKGSVLPSSESPQEKHSPPQNLCDKFRASKCVIVIGKSPLGPSQERWGWGGHVSRETRCKGPPSATVAAPSSTVGHWAAPALPGWHLPPSPPNPPEPSPGLPDTLLEEKGLLGLPLLNAACTSLLPAPTLQGCMEEGWRGPQGAGNDLAVCSQRSSQP